jgi:excisionase family DNA binding protein
MYPSMLARRIFDDAWLLICQNDLSTAVGVAAPPVMTVENQHIESLARRVGELLESIARKLLRTGLARRSRRDAPPRAGVRGVMGPREQGRTNRQPRLPAHLAPITVLIERPARPLTREQAARVLGLHPRTLDRWARRGRLLTIDLGGTVRIPVAETLRLQPIAAPRRTA